MKVVVLGGDGFCGWPTALGLASEGDEVVIIDNGSRRQIDIDLGTKSLVDLSTLEMRVKVARTRGFDIRSMQACLVKDRTEISEFLRSFCPEVIVHFAEQRSAPYSMIDDERRRYTVDGNIGATHNLLSAVIDVCPEVHLIHLGTMGVYGYNDSMGVIPEGYLDVQVLSTGRNVSILYPTNPGSIYHLTKSMDQLLFQYYAKNWNLNITDLHQGIVWGVHTAETLVDDRLVNRFDYDGVYGTVLNRFLVQASQRYPLTIYGTGGQTRAFIHISDTVKCISIAKNSYPNTSGQVRIFNQVAETKTLKSLAEQVSSRYGSPVQFVENPRNELPENALSVSNEGLRSLGFRPKMITEEMLDEVFAVASKSLNFESSVVLNSPQW